MINIFKDKVFPITGDYNFHLQNENGYAVDFGCPVGTSIYAPVSGTLVKTPSWYGGPNHCQLVEKNGNTWVFEHCSEVIKLGWVNEGDLILKSGNLGNSTGPHLHFTAGSDKSQLDGWGTTKNSSILDYYLKNFNKIMSRGGASGGASAKTPKRDTKLVKFLGEVPLYYNGKEVAKTRSGWFGRIMRVDDGGYLIEFKGLLCYAKNGDINGPKCSLTNGEVRKATRCRTTGDLPLLGVDLKEKLKTANGWKFWLFRSEYNSNYYTVRLDNGQIYYLHKNYANGSRVFEV